MHHANTPVILHNLKRLSFKVLKAVKHRLNQSLSDSSGLSHHQALQFFQMDDSQFVESKPLLVDRELPVCILNWAKSNNVCLNISEMWCAIVLLNYA